MDSTLLLLDTTKGKQIKQKACFASFLFLSCNCFGKEGEERREGDKDRCNRPHRPEIPPPWCPYPGNFVIFRMDAGGVGRGTPN